MVVPYMTNYYFVNNDIDTFSTATDKALDNPFNIDLYQCCKGGLSPEALRALNAATLTTEINLCKENITLVTNLAKLQEIQTCMAGRIKARGLNVSIEAPTECLAAALWATGCILILTFFL